MSKTLYISGPMTNVPQFNVPLFDAVAACLREKGWNVVSPAELDSDDVRAAALASPDGKVGEGGLVANETWGDMLSRDVKLLADGVKVCEPDEVLLQRIKDLGQFRDNEGPTDLDIGVDRKVERKRIDAIALLPGWEKSRGARLEAFVGLLTDKYYFTVEAHRHGPTQDVDYMLEAKSARWVEHMLACTWEGPALYRPL